MRSYVVINRYLKTNSPTITRAFIITHNEDLALKTFRELDGQHDSLSALEVHDMGQAPNVPDPVYKNDHGFVILYSVKEVPNEPAPQPEPAPVITGAPEQNTQRTNKGGGTSSSKHIAKAERRAAANQSRQQRGEPEVIPTSNTQTPQNPPVAADVENTEHDGAY